MKTSTYQELDATYKELCRERNKVQAQIDENLLSINEALRLSKEILDKEEEDFRVFSPRKITDLHKDELDQFHKIKTNLEEQNGKLTVERDRLDKIIHVIQLVLEESEENTEEEKTDEEVGEKNEAEDDSIEKLKMIKHKVELSSKLITQDPVRAKHNLETVCKDIDYMLLSTHEN